MSALRPLIIVGAGGFSRETAELVVDINSVEPRWDLLGFVDDDPTLEGVEVNGVRVLGPAEYVVDGDAAVVICIGRPGNYAVRPAIVERLGLVDERYATLIHPSCSLARSTTIGPGTVVHAQTVATCDVQIGAHVAIMPAVVLTHDGVVGDHTTFGAGVRLAGGVQVGCGAYVGSGALVREGRTIGERSLVGMGSVVTRDVPPDEVWAGVPAAFVRHAHGGSTPDMSRPGGFS